MRLDRRAFLSSTIVLLGPMTARAATPEAGEGYRLLAASRAEMALLAPPKPRTLANGFGGSVPGPLLRYKKGEDIKIRLVNELAQPVTFSCQNTRIVNAMDGVGGLTQSPILPGRSSDYRFAPPDSGFYWYRSNAAPDARIDPGLYGPLIIDEAEPPPVDRDLVLILGEWNLDAAAQIRSDPDKAGAGRPDHSIVTVNSTPGPVVMETLPGARVRLRLLSMIGSQIAFVAFTGLRPLIAAIDGQPCVSFSPLRQTIPIGPGACFDVICDLPPDAATSAVVTLRTGGTSQPLATFAMRGTRRPPLPAFGSLPANPLLPARIDLQRSRKINLVVEDRHGALSLGGAAARTYAPEPLFSVRRGAPVTLSFTNKTPILLQAHVGGHALRILHDLDDGWDPYWRSNVIVSEGRAKHVAFVADNPGKWVIACQTLEPHPRCLVTWFEVS
ncbi:MAG: multicopper oxidase family protein [Beijerinckiaceae bacterium]|nr:MAG: multicopper oxidase family protein [Beijerinckiaceae bacterium]